MNKTEKRTYGKQRTTNQLKFCYRKRHGLGQKSYSEDQETASTDKFFYGIRMDKEGALGRPRYS